MGSGMLASALGRKSTKRVHPAPEETGEISHAEARDPTVTPMEQRQQRRLKLQQSLLRRRGRGGLCTILKRQPCLRWYFRCVTS